MLDRLPPRALSGMYGIGAVVAMLAAQAVGSGPTVNLAPAVAAVAAPDPVAIDTDVARLTALAAQADGHVAARVFAEVEGVDLVLPADRVLSLGFHETGADRHQVALQPRGRTFANHNQLRVPSATALPGPAHVVLPSRGRDGHPTSAADVVMPAGQDVLAPVTGTVVKVAGYLLYGEHEDVLLEIRPDSNPDLVVMMFHVTGPQVREGQHVEAGRTVVADGARVLPFVSDIEAVTGTYAPHVDLRVRWA